MTNLRAVKWTYEDTIGSAIIIGGLIAYVAESPSPFAALLILFCVVMT